MLFSYKQKKNKMRHHAWLYSAVFSGRFSTLLVFVLFVSFMLQPFHKAIASEPVDTVTETELPIAEEVQLEEPAEEEQLPAALEEVVESTEEEVENAEQTEEVLPEEQSDGSGGDIGTTSEESLPEDSSEEADPLPESVVEVQYLVTEENYYQFNKNACVTVGDGAFHCSTNDKSELD